MPTDMTFGPALRSARMEAGMSLAALAKAVNYSKGYLNKIESGASSVSVPLARRCDAAVGADGGLAELVAGRPTAQQSAAEIPGADGGGQWLVSFGETGSWFLPAPGAEVACLAHNPGIAFPLAGPSRAVSPELETAYLRIFENLRTFGRSAQPGAVLPMLISQIAVLRRYREAAPEPLRSRLTTLAARCAEYAGWMAQEAGDDRAARWWTKRSELMASSVGDLDLVAYSLVRQAELTLYQGDPLTTVDLAGRAGQLPGASLRTRALAAHREAQGHALAGDSASCAAALDTATAYLDSYEEQAAGVPLGSTTVGDLGSVVAGWCAYDLGDITRAIELLESGLRGIPVESIRVRAVFGSRLALAHEVAGNHAEVERLTREVLAVVPAIESASVRSQLRILGRALIRSGHHPSARELHAALAEALRESGPGS